VGTGVSTPEVPELPITWGYNWATRPQRDINSSDWPSRLGVDRKASDLTLENIYCYGISNKNNWNDLSKTTFTTMKIDLNTATWNVRSMLQAEKMIKAKGLNGWATYKE
jgi:hypothetical protein